MNPEATAVPPPGAGAGRSSAFSLPATPRDGRRSRFSWADVAVIAVCLLAMIAGYWMIRSHNGRMAVSEVAGAAISHPAGWLQTPAVAPGIATWVDSAGTGATLAVYQAQTEAEGLSGPFALGLNPASSSPGFTVLGSRTVEVEGSPAVATDYAYARQVVGRGLPPAVIRGRQVAWIRDGALLTVALEAPEGSWHGVLRDAGRALPGGAS